MPCGLHTCGFARPLFLFLAILVATLTGCGGLPISRELPRYPIGFTERGVTSWYGPGFDGKQTASGERYDMHQLTAAHRTLPLGSVVSVQSMTTGRQVTVRINDRGPFAKGRVLDLSLAGAHALGIIGTGTDLIELRVVEYHGPPVDVGSLRVQVGSFADLHNAQNLLERLKPLYEGGRVQTIELPHGKRYRVQTGQFLTLAQAEVAANHLAVSLGFQSFVVREDR